MKKVVINACFGGFSLSDAGIIRYAQIKGLTLYPEKRDKFTDLLGPVYWTVPPSQRPKPIEDWHTAPEAERHAFNEAYTASVIHDRDLPRDDPALVQTVEELGENADGRCAKLRIVEIPDDVEWQVEEYDGSEHIAETHRTWR